MSQKPAHEIRLGRIRATIWANSEEGHGENYTVMISRLYRDGERWKDSTVFYRDDMPLVAKAADMAYAWVWIRQSSHEIPTRN